MERSWNSSQKGCVPRGNREPSLKEKGVFPVASLHRARWCARCRARHGSARSCVQGFTLIELLVVIAIVAILSVVLVLTLNPAQLLRQARDSTRISDLNIIKRAIDLYMVDVTSPSLGTNGSCYVHASSGIQMANTTCSGRYLTMTAYVTSTTPTVTTTTSRSVNGTGWIPVNLTAISSGAPLGLLPVDPINNATYFYSYAATSTSQTFELNADMESTRYANGGSGDVESTDGGSSSTIYEVGTHQGLSL